MSARTLAQWGLAGRPGATVPRTSPLPGETHTEAVMAVIAMVTGYTIEELRAQTVRRLGGSRKSILRRWVYRETGGRCASCNRVCSLDTDPTADDYFHLAHVIPCAEIDVAGGRTRENRAGYLPGNIYGSCLRCNYDLGENRPDLADFARPDLIPLAWPPLSKRNPCA